MKNKCSQKIKRKRNGEIFNLSERKRTSFSKVRKKRRENQYACVREKMAEVEKK